MAIFVSSPKRSICPISAIMPAANTEPMPGTVCSVCGTPFMIRSIDLSSSLICFSNVRINVIEVPSIVSMESSTTLSNGRKNEQPV